MSTFVLVHGMSHGAWAWGLPTKRLERAGHRVLAVDLPRHGRRAHERARASVGAAQYAARLGVTPIDMNCAYGPMLSAPDALAKILEAV
jgi:pimeloyl-ACP methyl ester carboxylesterase